MTQSTDARALLAAHDAQLRGHDLPPGGSYSSERDGPVLRAFGGIGGGWISYRDLGGLEGEALDALIARQVAFFAERNATFEWKTYAHDLPADLPQRLMAAGFRPEERETVVIGLAAPLANPDPRVDGVTIRRTTDHADFERIAGISGAEWIADMLKEDIVLGHTTVYLAEADGRAVSAGWIRNVAGTDFAGLWGGATLPEYRRKGIYSALVAVRAAQAVAEGYPYLQVDASDNSRPILERLGFIAVTTTTPYIWTHGELSH